MALTTLTSSCVSIESAFQFGGQSGKKRKMVTVVLNDPAATSGGMTIGANTGDIPASALGFTKIESSTILQVFTTSTGAPVRLYLMAPDLAGTSLVANVPSTATDTETARAALTDVTIATTESARVTLIGY